MKLTPFIISSFAKFIASGEAFKHMREAVMTAEAKGGTGQDKKQIALSLFAAFAQDLTGWIVNLLLELAVAWLNSQKPK